MEPKGPTAEAPKEEDKLENGTPEDAVNAAKKIISENGSEKSEPGEKDFDQKWKAAFDRTRAKAEAKKTANRERESVRLMGEGWEKPEDSPRKRPTLAETVKRLEAEGKDAAKMETPLLAKAGQELKAKQEASANQKGPLTTVEGLLERVEAEKPLPASESQAEAPKQESISVPEINQEGSLNTVDKLMARVESDKAQSEKRNIIEEAKQITKENTSEYLEGLTKKLQQELGDNLILERAGLTDSGFEIIITDQSGRLVYDVNELPKESISTYNALKTFLTEELKDKYNSSQVDAAVAKGEADAKTKSGLWGRVKKFFGIK